MTTFFSNITRVLFSIFSVILMFFSGMVNPAMKNNDIVFNISETAQTEVIGNKLSNINVWNGFALPSDFKLGSELADCSGFVEYVQLMQATGGSAERDLFTDPYNFAVLDDYDFTKLLTACRTVLNSGAKPLIKTGNVPMKYSQSHGNDIGYFSVNRFPPDDYGIYYDYLCACFNALIEEFGIEEVQSWRFGVFTEFDNADWFVDTDDSGEITPEASCEAFCKIYDYTVAALQNTVGENVFVGAHSMTVTDGLWDAADFLTHVATGKNYYTGETGTRICYISASFYDFAPERYTTGKTLPETINHLRKRAEKVGLTDLIYGVDEGRILEGNISGTGSAALLTRITGRTWQGAYDARLLKQMLDNDIDYFSAWGYTSVGISGGYPSVSFHTASCFSKFTGMNRLSVKNRINSGSLISCGISEYEPEVEAVAAMSQDKSKIEIMAYNFKNDLSYAGDVTAGFAVDCSGMKDGKVDITVYRIDDDANFFDEWLHDREVYGITQADSLWSPEDPALDSGIVISSERAKEIYNTELRDKYIEYSKLVPEKLTGEIENGKLRFNCEIKANTVVFFEITDIENGVIEN